jgi:hypothetical protein
VSITLRHIANFSHGNTDRCLESVTSKADPRTLSSVGETNIISCAHPPKGIQTSRQSPQPSSAPTYDIHTHPSLLESSHDISRTSELAPKPSDSPLRHMAHENIYTLLIVFSAKNGFEPPCLVSSAIETHAPATSSLQQPQDKVQLRPKRKRKDSSDEPLISSASGVVGIIPSLSFTSPPSSSNSPPSLRRSPRNLGRSQLRPIDWASSRPSMVSHEPFTTVIKRRRIYRTPVEMLIESIPTPYRTPMVALIEHIPSNIIWLPYALSSILEVDVGTAYYHLIVQLIELEYLHGFLNNGGRLSYTDRPAEVKRWIATGRGHTPIEIGNVDIYAKNWWRWWKRLQPAWRKYDNKDSKNNTPPGNVDDWDCLLVPGANGLLGVVASLYWWGCTVRPLGKLNHTHATGAMEKWLEAVTDCSGVVEHLISTMRNRRDSSGQMDDIGSDENTLDRIPGDEEDIDELIDDI